MDFVAGLHSSSVSDTTIRNETEPDSQTSTVDNDNQPENGTNQSTSANTKTEAASDSSSQELKEGKHVDTNNDPSSVPATSTSASTSQEQDQGEGQGQNKKVEPPPVPTIEAELDEMMNTLNDMGKNIGSFWGSFRQQGLSAWQSSRKNLENYTENAKKLGPYVDKAKDELNQLGAQAKQVINEQGDGTTGTTTATTATTSDTNMDNTNESNTQARQNTTTHSQHARGSSFYGEVYTSPDSAAQTPKYEEGSSPTAATRGEGEGIHLPDTSALFSKFQSQLNNIPLNWKPNLEQIQSQLHRFEDRGSKLAEDYYHKSEAYFKGAGEMLRDAVKVVPPEEEEALQQQQQQQQQRQDQQHGQGQQGATSSSGSRGYPSKTDMQNAMTVATGRKEALLLRLRNDASAVLLVDPAQQPIVSKDEEKQQEEERASLETKNAFENFVKQVESKGGIEGEEYQNFIKHEVELKSEGISSLILARDSIVPQQISLQDFWLRYFFRKHQIEQDEAKRKKVLQEASRQTAQADQDEDDFTWDDDDDDDDNNENNTTSTTPKQQDQGQKQKQKQKEQEHQQEQSSSNNTATAATKLSTTTSPRNSSEEGTMSSYDLVSSTGAQSDPDRKKQAITSNDDDDDSDWE